MYIIEKQTKMFFHPGSAGKRKGKPKSEFIFHLPAKIGVVPKTGPAKKKGRWKFGFNLLENRKLHN